MRNLTRTLLVALFAFNISVRCPSEPAEQRVQSVSIFRVLAAPEKFDGMRISIEGFINIAPDNAGVFTSSEARRYGLASYAVWINTIALPKEKTGHINGKCCRVAGVYHYDLARVSNGFVGKIDVEAIENINEDYVDRRDVLIGQLGYVNGMLLRNSDKLSAKEKVELERQKKDLEEMLRSVEDSPNGK